MEHLLAVPPQEERREWSAGWVREHLYQTLYDFISRQPLLPVHGEFHALTESGIRLKPRPLNSEKNWRHAAGKSRAFRCPGGDGLACGLCPGTDPASWLAALYDLGMDAEETAIRAGEFSLFPSQDRKP